MSDSLHAIDRMLAPHGLRLRGGFNFDPGDDAPPGPRRQPAEAVLLVGQVGREAWGPFEAWLAGRHRSLADPLDTWSREVIGRVAGEVGARAVGPNDRPFPPFQRWAMRAEGLRASPLGILMHPVHGLWHAYRGALLFDHLIEVAPPAGAVHACDACSDKPCLNACPAGAYAADGFAHAGCLSHLRTDVGQTCMAGGCLARNACPVGAAFRYPPAQQGFHMRSFARP